MQSSYSSVVSSQCGGVLVRTRDADAFYLLLNQLVVKDKLSLETVAPADDDVNSVYQYLIGSENKTI